MFSFVHRHILLLIVYPLFCSVARENFFDKIRLFIFTNCIICCIMGGTTLIFKRKAGDTENE